MEGARESIHSHTYTFKNLSCELAHKRILLATMYFCKSLRAFFHSVLTHFCLCAQFPIHYIFPLQTEVLSHIFLPSDSLILAISVDLCWAKWLRHSPLPLLLQEFPPRMKCWSPQLTRSVSKSKGCLADSTYFG